MLRFTQIAIGESAGVRCRRCHGPVAETFRDAEKVLADVTRAIAEWPATAGPNLAFAGIEPLRHAEIASIVSTAVDAGARRIRLDSDAAAFDSEAVAANAIRGGVRHLRVTLLGSAPGPHDALAGCAGAFDATMRGVATFTRAGAAIGAEVDVTAMVPICKHNVQDLPSIAAAAARAGVSAVTFAVDDPTLDVWSAAPWIESACDTGIVNAMWVEAEGVPWCAAPGWELHLASVYRDVAGAKAPACADCPLDALCGGAASGAGGQVTGRMRPPADAAAVAERATRALHPVWRAATGGAGAHA